MAYNPTKAANVVAYFVIKNGRVPLDAFAASQLAYLADRESIARYGFPIQSEMRVSTPDGPVNSDTYRCLTIEGSSESCRVGLLQRRNDHTVALARGDISEKSLDELSIADAAVLDTVWEKFGHLDAGSLTEWLSDRENVPEWEPESPSAPIPLLRIMKCLNLPDAEELAQTVDDLDRVDSLLRGS